MIDAQSRKDQSPSTSAHELSPTPKVRPRCTAVVRCCRPVAQQTSKRVYLQHHIRCTAAPRAQEMKTTLRPMGHNARPLCMGGLCRCSHSTKANQFHTKQHVCLHWEARHSQSVKTHGALHCLAPRATRASLTAVMLGRSRCTRSDGKTCKPHLASHFQCATQKGKC